MTQKMIHIPEGELMTSGQLSCAGCGATITMRFVLKALGEKTVLVIPACCWSVIDGPMPYSSVKVPLYHTAFEAAASTAAGVKAALVKRGDTETTVVAWAGDGGTFDIGIQALSACAERNTDFMYVCYDNEAYMNTGIQRSSATPFKAWTTTTPEDFPKEDPKKNMVEIMAAHQIPYTATASIGYPEDLMKKVEKAKGIKGTRFLHILAPCPPGWKTSNEQTISFARQAVDTCVFPLFEVERGIKYTITYKPSEKVPVSKYLSRQGRFRHLTKEDVEKIQAGVDQYWERLLRRERQSKDL
jgi:pyruvate ferredoxin oxidoreductase beta subunit/2-oxoisovalerate ferredoxin oxidoreductase beta subunit